MTTAIEVTESGGKAGTSLGPSGTVSARTGTEELAVQVAISDSVPVTLPSTRLSPQQLYSEVDDSLLAHVSGLIQRAKSALHRALSLDAESDFAQFDQEIMLARALISRSLNCREIGIGFTAVVNAINWALANREAGSPTRKQINALVEALNRVTWSPYLHFDTAMSVLDNLEEAELNIESPGLGLITAALDD